MPEAPPAGSALQAVRTSQAAGSKLVETSEPRSVPAKAPTILDSATPTGLTYPIAPYVEGASVEVLAKCFADAWSREERQRLLLLVEHRAAAAHAEAEAERTASREVRNRSESGPAPSAMLPSDPPTVSAPEGAPPPGRPQRKPSTKVRATADTNFFVVRAVQNFFEGEIGNLIWETLRCTSVFFEADHQ